MSRSTKNIKPRKLENSDYITKENKRDQKNNKDPSTSSGNSSKTIRKNNSSQNSLTYSTDSSDDSILRPSSTIKWKSNASPPGKSKVKLREDWKDLFLHSSTNINKRQQQLMETHSKVPLLQTKIFNPASFQSDNLPFGDNIQSQSDTEGVLFHNINGIKDESNWTQINITMSEINITCFGLAEINTTLRRAAYTKWNDITRRTFRTSKCSFSESDIQSSGHYKPGGTITTVVGKWQARITERGKDPSGLGRWSFVKISSNKKNLIIITAYRPCKTVGPTTTWTQQWLLLRESQKDPDPIKQFDKDLMETLGKWKAEHHEIILLINANEEIGAKPGSLNQTIASAGLIDLISSKHGAKSFPNTYARGSKRIDYIFGSENV